MYKYRPQWAPSSPPHIWLKLTKSPKGGAEALSLFSIAEALESDTKFQSTHNYNYNNHTHKYSIILQESSAKLDECSVVIAWCLTTLVLF